MSRFRVFSFTTRLTIIGIALILSGVSQTTQSKPQQGQQPLPTLRTTTNLVVVDVVVTNGKGEPLTDLKPEDFTVSENGKPQQVKSFNLHQSSAPDGAGSTKAQPLSPGIVSNVPQYKPTSVWNVILLDYLNSQVLSQADMRQQLLKVLDKIPDEPVAVYLLTDKLHLLHDFSSDHADLKGVIAELKDKPSAKLDNAKGGHEAERYNPVFLGSLRPEQLAALLRMEAQATGFNTEDRLRRTVDALNMVVRNVSGLPGRKNLIWISQAFPFSIDPGQALKVNDAASGRDFTVTIPGTANALLDAQVAIYTIDPAGMAAPDEFDPAGRGNDAIGLPETQVGVKSTVSNIHNAENATHASVSELAERTGGRAFYNQNDIGDAVLRSMHDGGTYYTLTYYPSDKNWDGKFRRISVKVQRPGAKLRYRSGYFALDPQAQSHATEAASAALFRQALEPDTPISTALLFTARVHPPSDAQHRLAVDLQLEPGAITTQTGADNLQHVNMDCAVAVFNEKGETVKAISHSMRGALKPEGFERVTREGFPCHVEIDVPPGTYVLRIGAQDHLSGRIGSVNASVAIAER